MQDEYLQLKIICVYGIMFMNVNLLNEKIIKIWFHASLYKSGILFDMLENQFAIIVMSNLLLFCVGVIESSSNCDKWR